MNRLQLFALAANTAILWAGCAGERRPCLAGNPAHPLCGIHRIPLVTKRTFMPDYLRVLVHSSDERDRLDRRYPNAIPIGHSLQRTKDFPVAAGKITFCPKCESELEKAFVGR